MVSGRVGILAVMDGFRWWLDPGVLPPAAIAASVFAVTTVPPLALQAAAAWLARRQPPPRRARHAAVRPGAPARRVRRTTRTDHPQSAPTSIPSAIMGEGSGRPVVP